MEQDFMQAATNEDILQIRPQTIFDKKYKILSFISRGGMGAVYKAEVLGTRKIVAIKMLLDDASISMRKRFLIEMNVSSKLTHPYITQVISANVCAGVAYMVMEYIEGVSLDTYVWQNELALDDIMLIIYKIAEGLQYAHRKGIIHRDIKPANILIEKDGTPKIMDFGLARLYQKREHDLTKTGEIMGTPRYMSPEQITGNRKFVDKTTDIYSLGVVMYELITKEAMIQGTSTIEILYNINHNRPSSLQGVPRIVADIWEKSTAEKYNRYSNFRLFLKDMDLYFVGKGLSLSQRVQRKIVLHKKLVLLIIALIFIVTGWLRMKIIDSQVNKLTQIHEYINDGKHDIAQRELNSFNIWWKKLCVNSDQLQIAQLKIFEAKEHYNLIWSLPTYENEEIMFFKIKAAYFLDINILSHKDVKLYKTKIKDAKSCNEIAKYECFYLDKEIKKDPKNKELLTLLATYYEEKKIDISLLNNRQEVIDFLMIFANNYIAMMKIEENSKYEHYVAEIYKKVYELRGGESELNDSLFDIMKWFIGYILKQQKENKNILQNDLILMQEYLTKCSRFRPNDADILFMLAQYYIQKQQFSTAYLHYQKSAQMGHTKSLEPLLDLWLKDSRYANKSMWLTLATLSSQKRYKVEGLWKEKLTKIIEVGQEKYNELVSQKTKEENNIKNYDKILSLLEVVAENKNTEIIRSTAEKAIILRGYDESFDLNQYYDEKTNIDVEIIKNIKRKIDENKKKSLLYLLAQHYLYQVDVAKQYLDMYRNSIIALFHDESEDIFYRYLAGKYILLDNQWDIVIRMLSSKSTNSRLISNNILFEAGFIYEYNQIHPITIKTWEQAVFYAQIMNFMHHRIREYAVDSPTYNKQAIDIWNSLLSSTDNHLQILAASMLSCLTDKPNILKDAENILAKNSNHKILKKEYFVHLSWNKAKYLVQLTREDIQFFIKEFLSTETSLSHKIIMLDSYIVSNMNDFFMLNKDEDLKNSVIKAFKETINNEFEELTLRVKAAYKLANIIIFDKEYFEIVENTKLPVLVRATMMIATFFEKTRAVGKKPEEMLKDSLALEDYIRKLYQTMQAMEQKEDRETFKLIINKLAFFLGIKSIEYLNLTDEKHNNLKANTLMNFVSDDIIKEGVSSFLKDFLVLSLKKYKPVYKKDLEKIVANHISSEHSHLKMAASAVQAFNTIDSVILNDQIKNTADPFIKMGVTWGIYRKMCYSVLKNPVAYTTASFKTYDENLLDEMEQNLIHKKDKEEYIKNLQICIQAEETLPPENKDLLRINNYIHMQAFLYFLIGNHTEALQCLNKIENSEEYLRYKRQVLVLKVQTLFSVKETSEKIAETIDQCLEESNHHSLYKLVDIVKYYYQKHTNKEEWRKRYIQLNQKIILAIYQIEQLDGDSEKFLYNIVADCHNRLASLQPNQASFHNRCSEIIITKITK